MKRLFKAAVSILAVASVFTGCSGGNTAASGTAASKSGGVSTASAPAQITMRVAYMPNMSSASALITGIKMGYFKEQGIDVQTVKFAKGPDEIAAMGSGNIDVSQIGTGAHVHCAKGQAKNFRL